MFSLAGCMVYDGILLQKTGPLNAVYAVAAAYGIHCFFKFFFLLQSRILKKADLGKGIL